MLDTPSELLSRIYNRYSRGADPHDLSTLIDKIPAVLDYPQIVSKYKHGQKIYLIDRAPKSVSFEGPYEISAIQIMVGAKGNVATYQMTHGNYWYPEKRIITDCAAALQEWLNG